MEKTSGFSAMGVEELMLVNGGKGSSSSGSSSSAPPSTFTVGTTPKPDGFSPVLSVEDPGVSYKNGNTTVTVTAHIDYNNCPPAVTSVTATVSHGISK